MIDYEELKCFYVKAILAFRQSILLDFSQNFAAGYRFSPRQMYEPLFKCNNNNCLVGTLLYELMRLNNKNNKSWDGYAEDIDVQDCGNSIANTLELLQSYTESLILQSLPQYPVSSASHVTTSGGGDGAYTIRHDLHQETSSDHCAPCLTNSQLQFINVGRWVAHVSNSDRHLILHMLNEIHV